MSAPPRVGSGPSRATRLALALVGALATAGLLALSAWQIERRAWKLDLIDRVEQRLHAPIAEAPGRAQWAAITAANDEYRRVRVSGMFIEGRSAAVQAVTELGSGFWVLAAMRTTDGSVMFVNRGFVASAARDAALRGACQPQGPSTVTGLLRMSEPGGGFLRHNDAAADRWYSRDVQAIAVARGLDGVAPYFIDQDADAASLAPPASATPIGGEAAVATSSCPVSGLTVIAFRNNHLVYAITWLVLALMTAAATWRAAVGIDGRAIDRGAAKL